MALTSGPFNIDGWMKRMYASRTSCHAPNTVVKGYKPAGLSAPVLKHSFQTGSLEIVNHDTPVETTFLLQSLTTLVRTGRLCSGSSRPLVRQGQNLRRVGDVHRMEDHHPQRRPERAVCNTGAMHESRSPLARSKETPCLGGLTVAEASCFALSCMAFSSCHSIMSLPSFSTKLLKSALLIKSQHCCRGKLWRRLWLFNLQTSCHIRKVGRHVCAKNYLLQHRLADTERLEFVLR